MNEEKIRLAQEGDSVAPATEPQPLPENSQLASAEDALGKMRPKNIEERMSPEERERYSNAIRLALQGAKPVDLGLEKKD